MAKKEIIVTFRTITPLWTGDAWQKNKEIRPSSLIGSLRFWFSVYWKVVKNKATEKIDEKGVPKENLHELENSKENKTFSELLKSKIERTNSFDKAVDEALNELGLSVPSRIFGCTGWKSRVKAEIIEFEEEDISFDNLEFEFPLNKLQQNEQTQKSLNTKFWIKKILFKDNISSSLKLFKNVKIKLITTDYWWEEYLKDFLEYFKDKLILVGGKKSFGFGFVNLNLEENQNELKDFKHLNHNLIIENIKNINYSQEKKVLGFNFKYYLRKKENKKFRKINFGEQGQASKVYVSNLVDNNTIYLIILNSPFDMANPIPSHVVNKYKTWLQQLSQNNQDSRGKNNG